MHGFYGRIVTIDLSRKDCLTQGQKYYFGLK